MIEEFGDEIYTLLKERGAIQEWYHYRGFDAVTLTPWSAFILGFKLSEYWVRHFDRVKEYRGLNRRPARVRIQRWESESYWTYINRPDRATRTPVNTCELPLVGDPEDKRYHNEKQEYLEDWHTWSFTKNPNKALTITIRVGSFAHKIVVRKERQKAHKKKHQEKPSHEQTLQS